ncbi:MAG: S-layer homology domain-containing protein [Kiritimatiellales bacterium]|nr:S-layer homology domain-containing protein [Kiritimatiellales bacterium]
MRFLIFSIIGFLSFTGTAFAQNTTFSHQPFTDVSINNVNYEAIEYLRTQNVIRGYLDGTFKPNAIITRAEFVEFIINPFILDTNGMGECVSTQIPNTTKKVFFSDVLKNTWYAENICFAKMNRLVDGYPDGSFHPTDSINFVEASKIISNVFGLNVGEYQTGQFWYRPYVASLSDLHAIPTNIRRLNQTLSRADMAQIVYRLKVDSENKISMGFNQQNNSLYQRIPVTPVVSTPKPYTISNTFNRPSRRSIISQAENRNM